MPTDFLCTAQSIPVLQYSTDHRVLDPRGKGDAPGRTYCGIPFFHIPLLWNEMEGRYCTAYLYHYLLFICTYRMLFGKFIYASTAAVSEI